jgi:hypothetical protein
MATAMRVGAVIFMVNVCCSAKADSGVSTLNGYYYMYYTGLWIFVEFYFQTQKKTVDYPYTHINLYATRHK